MSVRLISSNILLSQINHKSWTGGCQKISSRHNDSGDAICSENRWVCVFYRLLSTAHSITAKQLNHSTTSVLEMKQRRFVLSVCQGGWSAAGEYSARLTHCYCLYKHILNSCRNEKWLKGGAAAAQCWCQNEVCHDNVKIKSLCKDRTASMHQYCC